MALIVEDGTGVANADSYISVVDADTGIAVAVEQSPGNEMEISAPRAGWAEQEPEIWWQNIQQATQRIFSKGHIDPNSIKSIGIAYQMHGLVLINKSCEVLRPAIIWCDSRAVKIGDQAFSTIVAASCRAFASSGPSCSSTRCTSCGSSVSNTAGTFDASSTALKCDVSYFAPIDPAPAQPT